MLTAAILAGGQASRLGGRDKSALVVGGRTIFERQMAALSAIAEEILVVGHPAPPPGAKPVADVFPGCGPLGGLHAALQAATGQATLAVACDMPYLSTPFLAYLTLLAGEADAVVPQTEDGYHPLCAVYTRAALEPIARRLAAGRLKVTDLLSDIRVRVVGADEIIRFGDCRRLLANVNTAADHDSADADRNQEP